MQEMDVPWRRSSVATKWPASSRLSWVPVSSHAWPRPRISESRAAGRDVDVVDVRDFQLTARRGLQILDDLEHLVVEEIQAGDGQTALGRCRLFFDAEQLAIGTDLRHAVALRIVDAVAEQDCAIQLGAGFLQLLLETRAVKDVVAQDQADRIRTHEVTADDEGFGQAIRRGLHGVAEAHPELFTGRPAAARRAVNPAASK